MTKAKASRLASWVMPLVIYLICTGENCPGHGAGGSAKAPPQAPPPPFSTGNLPGAPVGQSAPSPGGGGSAASVDTTQFAQGGAATPFGQASRQLPPPPSSGANGVPPGEPYIPDPGPGRDASHDPLNVPNPVIHSPPSGANAGVAAAPETGFSNAQTPPPAAASPPVSMPSAQAASGGGAPAVSSREFGLGWHSLAYKKLGAKDFLGAQQEAKKIIQAEPDRAEGPVLMAEALNGMGRYKEAEQASVDALRRDPNNAQAYEMRAWAQLGLRRPMDALRNAQRAVELNPDSARARYIRALAYQALGKREAMMADLRSAAQMDPYYKSDLEKGLTGARLFDPGSQDNGELLDALPGRSGSFVAAGLLLILGALLAGLVYKFRQKLAWLQLPKVERIKRDMAEVTLGAAQASLVSEDILLAGKYRVLRAIGQEKPAKTWEARDQSLGRLVMIREMSAGAVLSAGRALAALHHPNIVDIYEVLDHPSGAYLVFERVAGKSLKQVLAEKKFLSVSAVKKILSPVCDAVRFVHEHGVAYRNLSAAGIVLTAQGSVKVTDFALARRVPEAAAADVRALGTCLREALKPGASPPADALAAAAGGGKIASAAEFLAGLGSLSEPVSTS